MSRRNDRHPVWVAGAGTILLLACTGCAEIETPEAEEYQPASLSAAEEGGVKTVTLTQEAATRIELATAPVVTRAGRSTVPYAAVIYDGQGLTWVYTVVKPLTYKRARIAVLSVDESHAVLSSGPRPTTLVVTQGSTQVYGAELGMSGKH